MRPERGAQPWWRTVHGLAAAACCALALVFLARAALGLAEKDSAKLVRLAVGSETVRGDVERDAFSSSFCAACRDLDYHLPDNARVFVLHQLGPNASSQLGHYFFLNYYLFPRQVDIALSPGAVLATGPAPKRELFYQGRHPHSDKELSDLGYNATIEIVSNQPMPSFLTPLKMTDPAKRQLQPYRSDLLAAFCLPLLVALAGAALVARIAPNLYAGLGWAEKGALGLALGMMTVTQLAFGLRLLGLQIEWLLWWAGLAWAGFVLVRKMKARATAGLPRLSPGGFRWRWLGFIPLALLFVCLFRVAGLVGLREFDAVAGWAFKAKLFFLASGQDLIRVTSNPAWGHAHLDYPVLVPMLHALTYSTINHVNEFVTKFWMVWMLFFLVAAVFAACQGRRKHFWLGLGLATCVGFLPLSLRYALREGATLPLLFFLTLALLNLTRALTEQNQERLRLALLLLLGAALCKLEGMIVLALCLAALLANPPTRALFKFTRACRWALGLGLICLLPFVLWRLQIPTLHPEAGWPRYLLEHPAQVLANVPKALLALWSRQFLGDNLASWTSPDHAGLLWNGQWSGLGSVFADLTFGFAWLGILLSLLLARRHASARRPVLFLGGITLLFSLALCVVTSSLPENLDNLESLLSFSSAATGGRYLSPLLCAWVISLATLAARQDDDVASA